jgi:hypothetical protein
LMRYQTGFSVMASRANEFRCHAQECREAAPKIQSEEERKILLNIAQTWQRLAEEDEKEKNE